MASLSSVGIGPPPTRVEYAVVDVEQRGVSAFEEDLLAVVHRIVQQLRCVAEVRTEALGVFDALSIEHVDVEFFKWLATLGGKRAEHRVFHAHDRRELFPQRLQVVQIAHADRGRADGFVRIARPNAAAGRADLLIVAAILADRGLHQCILLFVIREHHVSAVADAEVGADLDASLADAVDFFEEFDGVDDHAVAEHVELVRGKDARGDQVERVTLRADLHGVARIGSAVVSNDQVKLLGEQVDDFALAFIAPLQPYDGTMAFGGGPGKECLELCRRGGLALGRLGGGALSHHLVHETGEQKRDGALYHSIGRETPIFGAF